MKEYNKNRIEFKDEREGYLAIVNQYFPRRFYGPEYKEYYDWSITPSSVFMKGDTKDLRYQIRYDSAVDVTPYRLFATLEELKSALEYYVLSVNKSIEENNKVKARCGVKQDTVVAKEDILVRIVKVRYSKQCSIVAEL